MIKTKRVLKEQLSKNILPSSDIYKDLDVDVLALNEVGEKYLKSLTDQMKDLQIYLDGDIELMLEDCALNYQLYRDHLEISITDSLDSNKNHMKAMRFLKVVQDYTKQLGIGPLQRHKLKAFKELKEDTIFDKIAEMRD